MGFKKFFEKFNSDAAKIDKTQWGTLLGRSIVDAWIAYQIKVTNEKLVWVTAIMAFASIVLSILTLAL